MTGFGRASFEKNGLQVTTEINAVNSRFAEVYVRTPRPLNPFEIEIQNIVKDTLIRGKFNVFVQVIETEADNAVPKVNKEAILAYKKMLDSIRDTTEISLPVSLDHLLKFQDIFVTNEDPETVSKRMWEATEPCLRIAIQAMSQMRLEEGKALKKDLLLRIENIENALNLVESQVSTRLVETKQKLLDRIVQLLGNEQFDKERLELEVALLVDKMDITEEIVRLRSHIQLFRNSLEEVEEVGRKLNFISQEFNREINTIGSKANNSVITTQVVIMKEELEKIREQVQNIV